jgi:hypothetical protein
VFLLAGSLQPNIGGSVAAYNTTFSDLQGRVIDYPFVSENVVSAEIMEISPGRVAKRLSFLVD